jgi:hypothetical protein
MVLGIDLAKKVVWLHGIDCACGATRCAEQAASGRPGGFPRSPNAGGEERLRGTARGTWTRDGETLAGGLM